MQVWQGIDRARLLTRLQQLVELESPSESPAGVNAAMNVCAEWAQAAGGRIVRHSQAKFGDVVELWFGPESTDASKPVLLLAHLDTVWPLGTLAAMPWRQQPDAHGRIRLWGPGVLDMKAGVVMALEAIAAVQAATPLQRPVVLLLNPDEEVGSPVSRPHTERLGRLAEMVLVLEPAQGLPGSADDAAYKTARKGVGQYRVQVTGVAAHSGVDFLQGHSAILELARILPKIAALTDLSSGITVNPGVIGGGTRSNVIAAEAWVEVDVRIAAAADADSVDAAMHALCCDDPACTLIITGGINRPPMERTPAIAGLFATSQTLAAELGIPLREASTGGGSDGNFTAALGTPTLDGMGAVGEGAHAAHESVLLEQLLPRTALLAALLAHICA